jgi:hypothetical protein
MKAFDIEKARKKIETLDLELSTFLQAVKEIKEIRNTVGELPLQLKNDKEEIENQKKQLEGLILSSNKLLAELAVHANEVILDLARKTDTMSEEIRSSIAQFDNVFKEQATTLQDEQGKRSKDMTKKIMHLEKAYDQQTEKKLNDGIDKVHFSSKNVLWVVSIILLTSIIISVFAFSLR